MTKTSIERVLETADKVEKNQDKIIEEHGYEIQDDGSWKKTNWWVIQKEKK